ncbi:MAG: hypothetical protein JWP75_2658 [Frondihabitans sp.]|jgi:uncharacterized protein (DUF2236 family)|nr:hypothetical protein [Frondihabitans sp.]
MDSATNDEVQQLEPVVVTEDLLLGTERLWRRFGEPVPAGGSLKPDGTPDYGLFGPGSITWEVLLHPATIVFEPVAQLTLQSVYKPIIAGVRDADPISRKARAGTLTMLDLFNRLQRNSGMHAPMWLGDTATAENMAGHLHKIHGHVRGDVIDVGDPGLGGYAAAEPRDAMWAGITEMCAILWMYENFAYHGEAGPRPLSDEQREQYVREMGAYLRLVGTPGDQIPNSIAELDGLYHRYEDLFGLNDTMNLYPDTMENYAELTGESTKGNWHPSHQIVVDVVQDTYRQFVTPILATFPEWLQAKAGLDESGRAAAAQALKDSQDLIKSAQQPDNERRVMRLYWGPDGVDLIDHARKLHREALQRQGNDTKEDSRHRGTARS